MDELLEYNSNFSYTAGSLWFYLKDEAMNFNANIAEGNDFRSFSCKVKLIGRTVACGNNGILRNRTFATPLRYLSIFSRALVNCNHWLIAKLN